MRIGILGLPFVGKTTLFNALTKSQAQTGAYAMGHKDPNIASVKVPDERLEALAEVFKPPKVIQATIDYIDVGGMTKGYVQNEASANLLAALRNVDALAHVVRVFEDESVPHIEGDINPRRDIENLNLELTLADLQVVEKRLERLGRELRVSKDSNLSKEKELLEKLKRYLESEVPIRQIELADEEEDLIRGYTFLTQKPLLLVLNLGEKQVERSQDHLDLISDLHQKPQVFGLTLCAKLEMEIDELEPQEGKAFLRELGIEQTALEKTIKASYQLLDLISFFTIGDSEVRAWSIEKGTSAVIAAGKIHSDMQRGFIRAESINCSDLIQAGSFSKAKELGILKLEGKDYIVKDGDVLTIRFSI